MSANEINQFEETTLGKSTALHAASYYGHDQVVEILLTHQADSTIRNFAGLTAYEEASTRDLVCAFRRHQMIDDTQNNRFSQANSNLEWVSYDSNMVEQASHYRKWLETGCNNMEFTIEDSIHSYLKVKEEFENDPHINQVEKLFQEAIDMHDPGLIVKAYTLETLFYRVLNRDLAATSADMLNQKYIFDAEIKPFWQTYGRLAAIIARHPSLRKYGVQGSFYRGMALSTESLLKYRKEKRILIKTFASCSSDSLVAKEFAIKNLDLKTDKRPALCTYTITGKRSALKLDDLSAYPHEREVLIVPFCVFEIVKITSHMFKWSNKDGTVMTKEGLDIELQECQKQNSNCQLM
ncbi:unnamed protein product [Rotaria sp. Silwood2]|nr:unnamed protein product [Rotaria sp. Silwood2]